MKCDYEMKMFDIVPEGLEVFHVQTRKGVCHGVFNSIKKEIFVHGVYGEKCLKGLMQILINKFKTNKITFTPLITESIPNSVRGTIKTMEASHPENPYGEELRYMECVWQ